MNKEESAKRVDVERNKEDVFYCHTSFNYIIEIAVGKKAIDSNVAPQSMFIGKTVQEMSKTSQSFRRPSQDTSDPSPARQPKGDPFGIYILAAYLIRLLMENSPHLAIWFTFIEKLKWYEVVQLVSKTGFLSFISMQHSYKYPLEYFVWKKI